MKFTPDKDNIATVNGYERHVVCAANRFPCGTIICGARHWDSIMHNLANKLGLSGGNEEQGFIDQWQNFMTREEAKIVAVKNKQPLREPLEQKQAYSENFY